MSIVPLLSMMNRKSIFPLQPTGGPPKSGWPMSQTIPLELDPPTLDSSAPLELELELVEELPVELLLSPVSPGGVVTPGVVVPGVVNPVVVSPEALQASNPARTRS